MKRNKILSSLLALTIAVVLVGCGTKADTTKDTSKDAPKTEEVY